MISNKYACYGLFLSGFSWLELDVFFEVSDTLSFVWLRLLERLHLRGIFAEELLVDALERDDVITFCILLHGSFDALREIEIDLVGEPEGEDEFLAFQLDGVSYSGEQ